MSDFMTTVRNVWSKTTKAVSKTANSVATSTKFTVDEMNIRGRQRETMKQLGKKTYQLWQEGVEMPEGLKEILGELASLDDEMKAVRADREAKKAAAAEERAQRAQARQAEKAARHEETMAAPVVTTDDMPKVEELLEEADEAIAETAAEEDAQSPEEPVAQEEAPTAPTLELDEPILDANEDQREEAPTLDLE